MAAGAETRLKNLKACVLFAPAGYDSNYLARMNPSLPLSLVWSESDNIISSADVREIFERSPSNTKQMIIMKDYPDKAVDHFFPLTSRSAFGDENGSAAFHFFGSWKRLTAAALSSASVDDSPYLYGPEALESGLEGLVYERFKSW